MPWYVSVQQHWHSKQCTGYFYGRFIFSEGLTNFLWCFKWSDARFSYAEPLDHVSLYARGGTQISHKFRDKVWEHHDIQQQRVHMPWLNLVFRNHDSPSEGAPVLLARTQSPGASQKTAVRDRESPSPTSMATFPHLYVEPQLGQGLTLIYTDP